MAAQVRSKLWDDVVRERLEECDMPEDQKQDLRESTIDSAKKELEKVQNEHDNTNTSKVFKRLKPLIEIFEKFADFAAQLATLDPHGVASLVFGSLRLVVKLASGVMDRFEKIASSFETIHSTLSILIGQDNRFVKNRPKPLENALLKVFNAYWKFFADVHSFLWSDKRHKAREFISHVGDVFKGRIGGIENDVEDFKKCCEEAREQVQFANDLRRDDEHAQILSVVEAVEAHVEEHKRASFRTERREFMHWLRPQDMSNKITDELAKRTPDTGTWMFKDNNYRGWLYGNGATQDGPAPVLWLSAGAGFGKSSLTAFLTHELRRTMLTGVAYFAFNSGTDFNTVPTMLCTLIHQLLVDETPTGEPHFAVEPSMMNHGFQHNSRADTKSLIAILRDMARRGGRTTVIIIDALDECPDTEDNKRDMKNFFEFTAGLPVDWKFLITSRPTPWFRHDMGDILASNLRNLSRSLQKEDINADIYAYINTTLQSKADKGDLMWDDDFRASIQEELWRRSEGMFKWTTLVLGDKRGLGSTKALKSMPDAREALKNAPDGVLNIYRQVLNRITEIEDDTIKKDMTRALTWILRSYRPMKIIDVQIALICHDGMPRTKDWLLGRLEDHLADILYINPRAQTVSLTHASAREFLTSAPRHQCPNGEQLIPNQLEEIDVELLCTSLRYLADGRRQFLKSTPPNEDTKREFARMLDNTGFLEYAAVGWIHHLETVCRAGLVSDEIISGLQQLFTNEVHCSLLKWMQILSFAHFTNRAGAAEAYSVMLDALSGQRSTRDNPLARLISQRLSGFCNHFGWASGGRFLRWQKFLASPAHPCFSPTLLASFFDFRNSLEEMIDDEETLHYGRGIKPSAPFWAAAGDAPDTLGLLLSDEHASKFPHRKAPGLMGRKGQSILKEATFVPRNMLSRPGAYPTAVMLVEDGCHVSYDFEVQLLENMPDSPGAAELVAKIIERVLPENPAFTFMDDSVGDALSYATFTGKSHVLRAMADNPEFILRSLKRIGKSSQDIPAEEWLAKLAQRNHRGMTPILHAAAINDSQALRLFCFESGRDVWRKKLLLPTPPQDPSTPPQPIKGPKSVPPTTSSSFTYLDLVYATYLYFVMVYLEALRKCGFGGILSDIPPHIDPPEPFWSEERKLDWAINRWSPLHLAAQRGCEKLLHRKGPDNEIQTDVERIHPSRHAVHALIDAGHPLDCLDSAENLPIHLAAYVGCEETLARLSKPEYDWDLPNQQGRTPLAITLEMKHLKAARLLIDNGAQISRVPAHLHSYLPSDSQGNTMHGTNCGAATSVVCVSLLRAAAKRWIPIPIIARIIRLADINEHSSERNDVFAYDELLMDMPYLQSPPIQPTMNTMPVKHVSITIRSCRQSDRHEEMRKLWSWIRMDKRDARTGRLVPWHSRTILRHNYGRSTIETIVFDDSNQKDSAYLKSLNPGDRIVVSPVALYPAWYAIIQGVRIVIKTTPTLRRAFSNQDRKRIWSMSGEHQACFQKYHDGELMVECLPGKKRDDGSIRKARRLPRPKHQR